MTTRSSGLFLLITDLYIQVHQGLKQIHRLRIKYERQSEMENTSYLAGSDNQSAVFFTIVYSNKRFPSG